MQWGEALMAVLTTQKVSRQINDPGEQEKLNQAGAQVKEIRESRGCTRGQVANRLGDHTIVHQLAAIENGLISPKDGRISEDLRAWLEGKEGE